MSGQYMFEQEARRGASASASADDDVGVMFDMVT